MYYDLRSSNLEVSGISFFMQIGIEFLSLYSSFITHPDISIAHVKTPLEGEQHRARRIRKPVFKD